MHPEESAQKQRLLNVICSPYLHADAILQDAQTSQHGSAMANIGCELDHCAGRGKRLILQLPYASRIGVLDPNTPAVRWITLPEGMHAQFILWGCTSETNECVSDWQWLSRMHQ